MSAVYYIIPVDKTTMISLHKTACIAAGIILSSSFVLQASSADRNRQQWRQLVVDRSMQEELLKNSEVPFKVKDWSGVAFFLEEYAELNTKAWLELGRGMYDYMPMITDSLANNGMPVALRFLPVAESRLKRGITSPAGAKGIWQFMKGTGRNCGLTINDQTDERLDPGKSTKAAVILLKKLYSQFGDWPLALAAYNCGQGKVRQAIRKTGRADYWAIQHLLPRQTRKYIPAYLAAACATTFYMQQGRPGISTRPMIFVSANLHSDTDRATSMSSSMSNVFCWADPLSILRKEKMV